MEKRDEMFQIPIRRYVVLIAVFFMLLAYFLMPMLSWPEMPMGAVLKNSIGSRYISALVPLSLVALIIIPFLELFLFIPKETSKTGRMVLVLTQGAALIQLYTQINDISVLGFSLVKLGPGFIFYSISAAGLFITELVAPEYSQQSNISQPNNVSQPSQVLQPEAPPQVDTPVKAEEKKEETAVEETTLSQTPPQEAVEEAIEPLQPVSIKDEIIETLSQTPSKETVRMMNEDAKYKVVKARWPLSNWVCAGLAGVAIVVMFVALFLLPLTNVLDYNVSYLLTEGVKWDDYLLIALFFVLIAFPFVEFFLFCLGWGNRMERMVSVLLQAIVVLYIILNIEKLLALSEYASAGSGLYCYAICSALLFLFAIFFRDSVTSEMPYARESVSGVAVDPQEEMKQAPAPSQDSTSVLQSSYNSSYANENNQIRSINILNNNVMKSIGNIVWLVFGGLLLSIEYVLAGLLLCCTIIGIPFGIQVFKFASLAFWPFGREVRNKQQTAGCLSTFMNILWIFIGGLLLAIQHVIIGLIFCITIIGIPFGKQHFKLAAIVITPFGREIVSSDKPLSA